MRIVELEIQNVRGIRDLQIKPDGRTFAIWGSNGSGKSAVIDAVDFLLTGSISRLKGRGTGDISLQRHGPHIDHTPADAFVRAIVRLGEPTKDIEISRSMENRTVLECSDSERPLIGHVLAIAQQGQTCINPEGNPQVYYRGA